MPKLIFLLAILIFFSCSDEGSQEKMNLSKAHDRDVILRSPIQLDGSIDSSILSIISFEEKIYNFDTITEGEIVEHDFHFTNTGQANLIISNVLTSCGCTTTDYPEEIIKPGESGTISVSFDSKDREGKQNKPITVTTNSVPSEKYLKIEGYVISKEN